MRRRVFLGVLGAAVLSTSLRADGKDEAHKIPDAARAVLEGAEDLELISLDPDDLGVKLRDGFHGWRVLGKTTVKDTAVRRKLVGAFEEGVSGFKGGPGKCFRPRHGIRARHEGKTAEFVICFECCQTQVQVQGEEEQTFLVSPSPADVFNEVLRAADVPLPRQPGKK